MDCSSVYREKESSGLQYFCSSTCPPPTLMLFSIIAPTGNWYFFTEVVKTTRATMRDTSDCFKSCNLFKSFEKAKDKNQKQEMLNSIIKELSVHSTVEEEMVYPVIGDEDHEKAGEAVEEHHVVKLMLGELAHMQAADEKAELKVKVLAEIVRHHVREEEDELLPMLKECGEDLDSMGEEVMSRKEKLMKGMKKIGEKPGRQHRKAS